MLLTLALATLAMGPALYAAATPSGPASAAPSLTGTLTKVDLPHHHITLKVTATKGAGAAKYKGRTVILNVKGAPPGATSVTRLGHAGKLIGLKKDDRVVITYKLNPAKQLVAFKVTDSGPKPKVTPTPSVSPTLSPTPSATQTTDPYSAPPPPPTSSIPANAYKIHMYSYGYTLDAGNPTVGQVVAVIADASNHSWTSGNGTTGMPDGTFDSGFLSSGANFQYTFTAPGTYTFFCKHHYSSFNMKGSITVDPAA